MRSFIPATLSLLFLLTAVSASPAAVSSVTTDNLTPLKWIGPIVPGGKDVSLEGDIHEIRRQILERNPNYDRDFNSSKNVERGMELDKRNRVWPIQCNPGGASCSRFPIPGDIDYLRNLQGGNARCVANARSCSRIACTDGAGIFLCNDRNDRIDPSCKYLADYAQSIYDTCFTGFLAKGQQFDTDNYNVIIKGC
ncbi:hypothetical protein B0J11DRAFT_509282 [Dendryphion nanum]|uniref:Uncharacterized protein n=1 Tax=Dendryphion nanum TaxID=256645 RepID=A0A9P9IE94_9PLEO|nr:hypothetical protein B0J11DRAFT_509282 [Dendryphion nanum]